MPHKEKLVILPPQALAKRLAGQKAQEEKRRDAFVNNYRANIPVVQHRVAGLLNDRLSNWPPCAHLLTNLTYIVIEGYETEEAHDPYAREKDWVPVELLPDVFEPFLTSEWDVFWEKGDHTVHISFRAASEKKGVLTEVVGGLFRKRPCQQT